jgi:hypothetical protein
MAGTNKGRQGYYRSSNSGVGLGLELSWIVTSKSLVNSSGYSVRCIKN